MGFWKNAILLTKSGTRSDTCSLPPRSSPMIPRAYAKRKSRDLIPTVAGEKRMLILNVAARRNGLRCGTHFAVGHAFIMYIANPSKDREFGQTIGFLEKRNLVDQKAANNRRRAPGSPSGRSGEAKKWGFDTQNADTLPFGVRLPMRPWGTPSGIRPSEEQRGSLSGSTSSAEAKSPVLIPTMLYSAVRSGMTNPSLLTVQAPCLQPIGARGRRASGDTALGSPSRHGSGSGLRSIAILRPSLLLSWV
jgi:hypothetical protein